MLNNSEKFNEVAAEALNNSSLQHELFRLKDGFQARRSKAVSEVSDFDQLRDRGRQIKRHTIRNMPEYLQQFENNVINSGGNVHWAEGTKDAQQIILDICRSVNAKMVAKGKSMATEEIGLNDFLEKNGIKAVETDLGEYILQLRQESPVHIVAPAFHLSRNDVIDTFRQGHPDLNAERKLDTPEEILTEARSKLRDVFTDADVGITGANFLIANTGSTVIVTNEGNGDLVQTCPKVHIVVAGIEKIVPDLNAASVLLRLLSRSATGQDSTAYVTFSTGTRHEHDLDGPEEFHVVLLDNGRSDILGTENEEILHCIRCGACMNHCPVYGAVGGKSYGWVYPGPLGAALNPGLLDVKSTRHLPNASTFCGRCEYVCPMHIPLPKIMRNWRNKAYEKKITPSYERLVLSLWVWSVAHREFYRVMTSIAIGVLSVLHFGKGRYSWMLFASGWTRHRDLPAPEGKTFFQQWHAQNSVKKGIEND